MPRLVTLVDGSEVDSASQAWLLECLARDLLAWPCERRDEWLADFQAKRGSRVAEGLREAIEAVLEARTSAGPWPSA